ncbi:MAG: hypothetical protein ABEJ36_03120 [Candidatus Nanosalina sp.]
MKKLSLALVLLILLGTVAGFEASIDPVKRQATPQNPAIFQIEIKNTADTSETFSLNYEFTRSGWIYFDTSVTIAAGETEKVNVTINPGEDAIQQSYRFTIFVSRNGGSSDFKSLTDYTVVERQYEINIKEFTVDKTSYRPGEKLKGSITVQNIAPQIISDYRLYSSFINKSKVKKGIAFAPGALKTYDFSYIIPEDAAPGERNFSITLEYEDRKQTRSTGILVEKVRNITRKRFKNDRVLYTTGRFLISNEGNTEVKLHENMTFPAYLDAVLTFEPEPDSKFSQGSATVYSWKFTLEPEENMVIHYRVNYWIPLTIAAVILLSVVALRKLSGSVRIIKKVEEMEEGKLKISIELKNNSEHLQDDLKVRDFVPNVAELDEDFEMTRPDTKRTTDGIELEWDLDNFKPGEERVIQYEIEPKVEVEGGLEVGSAELVKEGEVLRKSRRK